MKQNPDRNKINKAQQNVQDIQNYRTTGSIIRSKEKLILEEEKLNKFFCDLEKQNQKQKTTKQLQKMQNKTTMITNDFEILKHCKKFFSTYIRKQRQTHK